MKNHFLAVSLTTALYGAVSFAVGDISASAMKFTIYKFAVSTSATCTSPITIFSSTTGVEQDMLASPTFGSGTVAAGTYPCVMIEMSKIIKPTPATTGTTSCTAGTQFNDVICNDTPQLSQLVDGTAVSCSGGIGNDQHVTLFITTLSAGTSGNRALLPPTSATDTTSGLKLTSDFIVSASVTGTLKVSYQNFLDGSGPTCSTTAPTFSFN